MNGIYLTFDEWSTKGYRIRKGAKGTRTNKNTIVFSQEQVWNPNNSYDDNDDYDYYDGDYWSLF